MNLFFKMWPYYNRCLNICIQMSVTGQFIDAFEMLAFRFSWDWHKMCATNDLKLTVVLQFYWSELITN